MRSTRHAVLAESVRPIARRLARAPHGGFEPLEKRWLMSGAPDPDPVGADDYEPNNSFAAATNLGTTNTATIDGLTIHKVSALANDTDFFKFVAPVAGAVNVRIDFTHQSGDLQLHVFNGSQQEIGSSNTSSAGQNFETSLVGVQAGQTYFVKVNGAVNPDYSLALKAQAINANFDWSMEKRFGKDLDAYGLPVIPNTADYARPNLIYVNNKLTPSFPTILDAAGDSPNDGVGYAWSIDSASYHTTAAGGVSTVNLPEGTYTVSLTASAVGYTVTTTQQVTVKNYLIVAMGDSYSSGEGNPNQPAQYDWAGFNTAHARWADSPDAFEALEHVMAHRSSKAGVAQAALELENSDPKTSVTFVFLSHTGATIENGLLGSQESGDYANPGTSIAQLDKLAQIVGTRHIDAINISIGGNDIGFGDILHDLVIDEPGIGDYAAAIDQVWATAHAKIDRLRDELYPRLAARLGQFDIGQKFLVEYPDLTKDASGGIADSILYDILPGLEVDRNELSQAIEQVMSPFNSAMHNACDTFGWNYVDGVQAGFSHAGYGTWFRTAVDSCVVEGPMGNRNVVLLPDLLGTQGKMHPIGEGLTVVKNRLLEFWHRSDLEVTGFTATSDDATTSAPNTATIKIRNNSFLNASAPAEVRLYASRDQYVTTSDSQVISLAVPAIAPGGEVTLSAHFTAIADTFRTSGNAVYLAPIVNPFRAFDETTFLNNEPAPAAFTSDIHLSVNRDGKVVATAINVGQTLSARLGDEVIGDYDMDAYVVNATAGQMLSFDVDSAGLDTFVRVYAASGSNGSYTLQGSAVAQNDDAAAPGETLGKDAFVNYAVTQPRAYVIVVSHSANGAADPTTLAGRSVGQRGSYALSVGVTQMPTFGGFSFDFDSYEGITAYFTHDVRASLDVSDLGLINDANNASVPLPTGTTLVTSYNAATQVTTATFRFGQPLADGNYRARFGALAIRDTNGTPLPSDYITQDFFSLAGDANRDRKVDFSDLLILARNYGTTGRGFTAGNFDYSTDGAVGFSDLLVLAQHYGKAMPANVALIGSGLGTKTHDRVASDVFA